MSSPDKENDIPKVNPRLKGVADVWKDTDIAREEEKIGSSRWRNTIENPALGRGLLAALLAGVVGLGALQFKASSSEKFDPLSTLKVETSCGSSSPDFPNGSMRIKFMGNLPKGYPIQYFEVVTISTSTKEEVPTLLKWDQNGFSSPVTEGSERTIESWHQQGPDQMWLVGPDDGVVMVYLAKDEGFSSEPSAVDQTTLANPIPRVFPAALNCANPD